MAQLELPSEDEPYLTAFPLDKDRMKIALLVNLAFSAL
jgi:hypothetical protein